MAKKPSKPKPVPFSGGGPNDPPPPPKKKAR